jgi:hypothetical protein
MEKNSRPLLSCACRQTVSESTQVLKRMVRTTNPLKAGCVQMRTRCPYGGACSSFAIGMNGCTSPLEPQICMAMCSRGAGSLASCFSCPRRSLRVGHRCAKSRCALSNQCSSSFGLSWNRTAICPDVFTLPTHFDLESRTWPRHCGVGKQDGIESGTADQAGGGRKNQP